MTTATEIANRYIAVPLVTRRFGALIESVQQRFPGFLDKLPPGNLSEAPPA